AGLYNNEGKLIVQNRTNASITSLHQAVLKISLPVNNPQLWWVDHPALYSVRSTVRQDGKIIDEIATNCGFRTIKFTADSGFYLNDTYMKIKGTCNHQDHAGVGVAVPSSLWEFRIRKLKEMGSNAFRCAHNPPAKEFLDACDKQGLLVMDENRNFNTSPEYQRQLEWMLRRDRNHPSIILWSVFNEEPMQGTETGYEMVRRMSSVVKNFDTTRPVTAAMSDGQFTPLNVSTAVDVVGFNYNYESYDKFHEANPALLMTSSEDVSGLMQRDVYVTDNKKHLLAAYDTIRPYWGTTHRVGWRAVAERRFIAGCFVWTGFDYRGEPTPYDWPTAGSNFGIMDACGFPKTAFYLHQAQWITDRPILQLVPHWNWPDDSIGKPIKVMAFSNAEKVKLLLNGKMIGQQAVDKYEMNSWEVPYRPGKLEAIGYKDGKEVSRYAVETTGEPAAIQLIADRSSIAGDGWDAVPVTVQVVDAKGRLIRTANLPVDFETDGAGSIIGMGNGDPNCHEPEKGNKHSVYNGLAQVILQSKPGGHGQLILTARSGGLKPASITVDVKDAIPVQSVD
ncbi:MAG TPA: glycoside hydrolase family 2 TIM barrel-domain containing protein, partial [Puia sp.]|nr:glycoside hydrolase family 2 TIM barrel-domain containing protein [Puia sp.]